MNQNHDRPHQVTFDGRLFLMLASAILCLVLIRTAWQADDAYAAWRLVDNFTHGFGLRYNIDERVQTFTSMLWTMLIAAFYIIFPNIYYVSVSISIILTILTFMIIAYPRHHNIGVTLLCIVIFIGSSSFTDFSTGGFENPLSHFIFAVYAYVIFNKNWNSLLWYRIIFVLAALGSLTRIDTALFYFPPALYVFVASTLPGRQKILGVLGWVLPIILWHSFTLFYFGFPLQNAAYAKRFNNLPLIEYLKAGFDYYLNSINRDPVTLSVIFSAIVMGLLSRRELIVSFAVGQLLYVIYVMFIGGDFMSGRFFSLLLVASVIVILQVATLERMQDWIPAVLAVVALAMASPHPPILNDRQFGSAREMTATSEWNQRGIADERASWYQHSGLLLSSRFKPMPLDVSGWEFRQRASKFAAAFQASGERCRGMIMPTGYFGFVVPRDCHIYDLNGQVDPLVARLPAPYAADWRQGHLFKPVVAGLDDSFKYNENRVSDPDLATYYEKIRLITRGDLWSWKRIKTIATMNLGGYQHHLRAFAARQAAQGR